VYVPAVLGGLTVYDTQKSRPSSVLFKWKWERFGFSGVGALSSSGFSFLFFSNKQLLLCFGSGRWKISRQLGLFTIDYIEMKL